jgi:hypothetical protein
MENLKGAELLALVPDGYTLVDLDKFRHAIKMAGQQGILPERFAEVLAKKPHVARMWGLKSHMEGAA